MDKSKSCYSYESRCKGFTRHGTLQSAPPSGESSGRPVDPRRAQPRVSSSLHPSFRIPRKDSSSSIRSPEAASRSKSSHWASRWDDRSRRERREVKDKHSSRSGLACLSDDRESSVKKGYREGCETGSDEELQGRGAKSIRPSSLSCGSERWIRKKAHMDRHASFTEAKRRRTGGSSEEEGGAPKSVRARLAQDRDKVFQLGTKQPTEVTTVLGPICGSPPYSNAQRGSSAVGSAVHHIEGAVDSVSCSVQAASSPEPSPPGVSPEVSKPVYVALIIMGNVAVVHVAIGVHLPSLLSSCRLQQREKGAGHAKALPLPHLSWIKVKRWLWGLCSGNRRNRRRKHSPSSSCLTAALQTNGPSCPHQCLLSRSPPP